MRTNNIATRQLNILATDMITSVVSKSPDMKPSIGKFLNYTNQNNLHGTSIVVYHSVYNDFCAKKDSFTREAAERVENLPEIIENEIKNSPLLTKHGDEFLTKVEKLYPTTLSKRVSLASQGAVSVDSVNPKSRFKKFMVYINQFLKANDL